MAVPRDGRFIEEIGYYNPVQEPEVLEINEEKALKWLGNGLNLPRLLKHY